MKRAITTLSEITDTVKKQVKNDTPEEIVNIIAVQLYRANDAKNRIDKEGIIVRDVRGTAVKHPAIDIEAAAHKLAHDIINKHKKEKTTNSDW